MAGLCWTCSYLRPLESIWWLLLNLSSYKPSKLALPWSKWEAVLRMEWTSTNKDGWDLSKGLRICCPFFFASKLYTVEYFVIRHFCPQLCPRGAACPLHLFFDPYRTWHTSSHQCPPLSLFLPTSFYLRQCLVSIFFFSFNFSLVISRKYFFTKSDSDYGRLNTESWTSHICTK